MIRMMPSPPPGEQPHLLLNSPYSANSGSPDQQQYQNNNEYRSVYSLLPSGLAQTREAEMRIRPLKFRETARPRTAIG